MYLFHRLWVAPLMALAFAGLSGCDDRTSTVDRHIAAATPTQAVTQLVRDLRHNDLAGYARHAVPPAMHARLVAAWRENRSRWPLTELPLHARLPGLLTTLAAPGAEKALLATYHRQFAGAHGELRSAAATLGQFTVQYLQREGDVSAEQRDHYVQLTGALSQWGQRAPLGDAERAKVAIPPLVGAARRTGLAGNGSFGRLGMQRSLGRMGPLFGRFKQVLLAYGLDLDAALDSVRVTLAEQTGDTARVRIRYRLAGQPIDAFVRVERQGGRWYLTDALRHAEAEAETEAEAADTTPVQTHPNRLATPRPRRQSTRRRRGESA